jgi:hypothetical protein
MSDKKKVIIILTALVVVLGGVLGFQTFREYLRQNPDDTIGNTAGNLNNGGYFCQIGEQVFFANSYDGNKLYVMNVDETDIKKLSDSPVSQLNADENYVYYYANDVASTSGLGGFSVRLLGIYRADHKGKKVKCLDQANCGVVKLLGNSLYYQKYADKNSTTLQQINVHSKASETVLNFPANPAAFYGSSIYYNGTVEDHNLYAYDITTQSNSLVYEGNVCYPDAQGDYIYFMDADNDYKLCRYDMSSGNAETLTEDRVDQYLVCGNYVFYQKNSQTEPALKVMYTDGSDAQVLAEGNYTDINATSQFVYFHEFGDTSVTYRISLVSGSFQIMTFDGAQTAALESQK